MIFISHRGNLYEKNPRRENTIDYINEAIDLGFDVEIDLWGQKGKMYLGHDGPGYNVDDDFLYDKKDNLLIHCKNYVSLEYCIEKKLHCFYHHTDKYTLTSKGFVWAYPGQPRSSNKCITVLPSEEENIYSFIGVCSDNIKIIKDEYV